ncbi:hypothetical protein AAAT68_01990 [Lawsonibacter asaccharolyticus]
MGRIEHRCKKDCGRLVLPRPYMDFFSFSLYLTIEFTRKIEIHRRKAGGFFHMDVLFRAEGTFLPLRRQAAARLFSLMLPFHQGRRILKQGCVDPLLHNNPLYLRQMQHKHSGYHLFRRNPRTGTKGTFAGKTEAKFSVLEGIPANTPAVGSQYRPYILI